MQVAVWFASDFVIIVSYLKAKSPSLSWACQLPKEHQEKWDLPEISKGSLTHTMCNDMTCPNYISKM